MYAAIQDFEKRLLFLQIESHIWLYRKNLKKFWIASFSTESTFRQIFEKLDFGLKKACYSDIRFRFLGENAFQLSISLNRLFLLFGFSFKNIHDSHDSRGRGNLFLQLLPTTSTSFTDTGISREIIAESSPLHIARNLSISQTIFNKIEKPEIIILFILVCPFTVSWLVSLTSNNKKRTYAILSYFRSTLSFYSSFLFRGKKIQTVFKK